jgi:hypothetical protein
MKGIFRDSHLKDGEIKYVNHIGESVLVKTKVNSKSKERGYINDKEPDFTAVLKTLVRNLDDFNLMDIGQILANSTTKDEAEMYMRDIEEYRKMPWAYTRENRPQEFMIRHDLFTKEGYILTLAPKERYPGCDSVCHEELKEANNHRFKDVFNPNCLP